MQIPCAPCRNRERQDQREPPCSPFCQQNQGRGPDEIKMLFDCQRPVVNGISTPTPADPGAGKVVAKEKNGTPPLPGANNDQSKEGKQPNDEQVKQRGRQDPAAAPNIKPAQADMPERPVLFKQS